MLKPLVVASVIFAAGCNHVTFEKDIVGPWESVGTPSSSALPEKLRMSPDWSATITFGRDGMFQWELDNAEGARDSYSGSYKVVGYSLSMTVTAIDGKPVPSDRWLEYTLRQQSTGAIQLPLPQDWTGPTVDYFKKS
jgi:hypothetical protein